VRFDVLVEVRLRPGIADPQGATIERALPALGFEGVEAVRVGKAIRFSVEAPDETTARARAAEMSERLLANPVIEDAAIEVTAAGATPPLTSSATPPATGVGAHR
jgi:phosphoribosylformylglycinamidine synthase PurS subunit